jgi:phage virion morphogenesis protein
MNDRMIECDNAAVLLALRELVERVENPAPCLAAMGEKLMESTKQRFVTKTAPDGTHWDDNKESTIARKGRNDPLVDSGNLNQQFDRELPDAHTLLLFSTMEYAAVQQFGAEQGLFGVGENSGLPIPFGDIPARPFLGVSDDDGVMMLQMMRDFLEDG